MECGSRIGRILWGWLVCRLETVSIKAVMLTTFQARISESLWHIMAREL